MKFKHKTHKNKLCGSVKVFCKKRKTLLKHNYEYGLIILG